MKKKSNSVVVVDFAEKYGNISSGTGSDNFFMGDGTDLDISNIPKVEEIIDTETVNKPKLGIETVEQPINKQLNNEKKQLMIIHLNSLKK